MENYMKTGKFLFFVLFVIVVGYFMVTYHITPIQMVNAFLDIVQQFNLR